MVWTRISLFYLCAYLLLSGAALLASPTWVLQLLQSTHDYGTVMPRFAGMLLGGLGIAVAWMVVTRSSPMYMGTVVVRAYFLTCLAAFYWFTEDQLFVVAFAVIAVGLVLTLLGLRADARSRQRSTRAPRATLYTSNSV